jgi:hypothetical protein
MEFPKLEIVAEIPASARGTSPKIGPACGRTTREIVYRLNEGADDDERNCKKRLD